FLASSGAHLTHVGLAPHALSRLPEEELWLRRAASHSFRVVTFILHPGEWIPEHTDVIVGPASALEAIDECWPNEDWVSDSSFCCRTTAAEMSQFRKAACFSSSSAGTAVTREHCCGRDGNPRFRTKLVVDPGGPKRFASLLSHVGKRGQFDYAIVVSMLEKLSQPGDLLALLPAVAKAGFISTPSRFRELAFFQQDEAGFRYRGSHLSRWVFTLLGGVLLALPKLPCLSADPYFDRFASSVAEVSQLFLRWEGSVPYKIVDASDLSTDVRQLSSTFRNAFLDDDVSRQPEVQRFLPALAAQNNTKHNNNNKNNTNNNNNNETLARRQQHAEEEAARGTTRSGLEMHALACEQLKLRGLEPRQVLDLGARSGSWAKRFRQVFPASRLFLVEPDRLYRVALRWLVPPRRRALRVLVGEKWEASSISNNNNDNNNNNRVHSNNNNDNDKNSFEESSEREKQRLPSKSLDLLCREKGWPNFDVVKLDLSSTELDILAGADETLSHASFIFVESASSLPYHGELTGVERVLAHTAKLGFVLYNLLYCHGGESRGGGLLRSCDLLLIRRELLPNFTPFSWGQQQQVLRLAALSAQDSDSSSPATPPSQADVMFVTYLCPKRWSYIDAAVMLGLSLKKHAPGIPRSAFLEELTGTSTADLEATAKTLIKAGWQFIMRSPAIHPPNAPKGLHFDGSYGKAMLFHADTIHWMAQQLGDARVEHVIYLDADSWVRSPLISELARPDLLVGGKLMAAVVDAAGRKCPQGAYCEGGRYNTGVMVYKPDGEKAAKIWRTMSESYKNDQPSINLAYEDEVAELHPAFNVHGNFLRDKVVPTAEDAVVVHFTGAPKPTFADAEHLRAVCEGREFDPRYGLLDGGQLYAEYFAAMLDPDAFPLLSPLLQTELSKARC
ncbi:unnamed protein product, partial [Polarella glacialis]